ncbi:DUF222 domain-containing protein [Paramicrobacterium sp. CJ85]|uniref:HNH endonuclease signature motif containing protein n=1 Tax=Paramicrobacterium sp. CJ85 TaxID=3445355 RepID=UPI003F603FD5
MNETPDSDDPARADGAVGKRDRTGPPDGTESANGVEPSDSTQSAEGSELADADASASDALGGSPAEVAAKELLTHLDGIVDDTRAVAVREAGRLRHVYEMLQTALEHPDIFVALSEGTTRGDLTNEQEEWVRSSLAQEIGAAIRVTKGQAITFMHNAETLHEKLPATLDALTSGAISLRHAHTMIKQSAGLTTNESAELEEKVLEKALRMSPSQFRAATVRARESMFPETIEERTRTAEEERYVECTGEADGMAHLHIFGSAVVLQSVCNAAKNTARALKAAGDRRTQTQIETDALIDAVLLGFTADQAPGVDAEGRGADRLSHIRPTVHVTVPVMTLLGHEDTPGTLDGYGPITPETARHLASQAPSFTRLLTHPETGAVLSVGRDSYSVPADLKRAIELRDETCTGIGCNTPANICDLDHRIDWQHGGETSFSNVAALCEGHHMLKHNTRWKIHVENGEIVWTSPLGRSYAVPQPSNVQFVSTEDESKTPDGRGTRKRGPRKAKAGELRTTPIPEYPEHPKF